MHFHLFQVSGRKFFYDAWSIDNDVSNILITILGRYDKYGGKQSTVFVWRNLDECICHVRYNR